MTQENTYTISHFKIPLSEYRVVRDALYFDDESLEKRCGTDVY